MINGCSAFGGRPTAVSRSSKHTAETQTVGDDAIEPAAAVKTFDAEGVSVQQFSEAASGQVVSRLHVMPMRTGVDLLTPQTRKEDTRVLESQAARMFAA
jgi:hypothetical protein